MSSNEEQQSVLEQANKLQRRVERAKRRQPYLGNNRNLENENGNASESFNVALMEQAAAKDSKIATKDEKIDSLEAKIESMKATFEEEKKASEQEKSALIEQAAAKDAEIDSMKTALQEEKARNVALAEQVTAKDAEIETIKASFGEEKSVLATFPNAADTASAGGRNAAFESMNENGTKTDLAKIASFLGVFGFGEGDDSRTLDGVDGYEEDSD